MAGLAALYLENVISEATKLKALAERAIAQVSDDQLFEAIDRESNSIAVIMRHVGGNLNSTR